MVNKSLLIAAIAAIVLCVLSAQASAFQVDLFEQKHFKGNNNIYTAWTYLLFL